MHPARVFISYRRDDAAGCARAIYDDLAQNFGADRVFSQPHMPLEFVARRVALAAAQPGR